MRFIGTDRFWGFVYEGDPEAELWRFFSFQELKVIRFPHREEVSFDLN